jgi:hypothetical protein
MKKILQGAVEHTVKVTRIKGHGYGVRVFVNGELNQQDVAPTRSDIGRVARGLLRMEDKCGNLSDFAHEARHRVGRKTAQR